MRAAWLRHRRAAPQRSATSAAGSPTGHAGQLVFAAPVGSRGLNLDCLLRPADRPADVGQPVHLVTVLAETDWLANVERDLVERWLTDGDPVRVEVVGVRGGSRVTLACAQTKLVLTLPAPPAALSRR